MIIVPVPSETPAARTPMARPGAGTRLTMGAMGFSFGAAPARQTFNHSFRAFLGAMQLTFNVGTVRSVAGIGPIIPQISTGGKTLPMNGTDGTRPTPLPIEARDANADGESWAVLEVHPDDATGELTKDSVVQIIHTDSPISHARTFGRCALVMILWQNRRPVRLVQSVIGDLVYFRRIPTAGGGSPQHFFL